ncbi:hypothetical protein AT251_24370 [Enterovibrio nigricans]|uniref:Uncharacterized protein n=2 Tax=Enterovibrio nigricans TaxID=504469 RepID=A0A1T4WFH8_9GAMM|nr:hypothetical protein AT251_24370 [Enterovibrio nigricans]SKA76040.1 hypothetical protein SAMN02745132_04912 [Enterovibrio nigricans DSM 22720]
MNITAITQDQLILIDGVGVSAVGGFRMERGEWALHFDTDKGIGHIEYLDSRPNLLLTQVHFDNAYHWLIEEFERAQAEAKREEEFDAQNMAASARPDGGRVDAHEAASSDGADIDADNREGSRHD